MPQRFGTGGQTMKEKQIDKQAVEEMAEVETFMEQFKDENIELIWGLSQDLNLEKGEVKVTVLATGFGMKDIPDMQPIIQKDEALEKELSRAEQEKKQKEEQKLENMLEVFYKPDFKVYIFKGEDMYNEELLAALDNSPTYSRSAQELERIMEIPSATSQPVKSTAIEEMNTATPDEEILNNEGEKYVEQENNSETIQ